MDSFFAKRLALAGLLGVLTSAALHGGDEPTAILRKDAVTVKASGAPLEAALRFARGQGVVIIPELSNDRRIYVTAGGEAGGGWVERDSLAWSDGTPLEGEQGLDDEDPDIAPRGPVASKAAESRRSRQESRQRPAPFEAGHPAPIGFREPARGGASGERGLPELLMRLVADVPAHDFSSTIVKDSELTRGEKIRGLKIFYKYLRDKRARLGQQGGGNEAERMALEWQSEDLLANLAKLQNQSEASEVDPDSSEASRPKPATKGRARKPKRPPAKQPGSGRGKTG